MENVGEKDIQEKSNQKPRMQIKAHVYLPTHQVMIDLTMHVVISLILIVK